MQEETKEEYLDRHRKSLGTEDLQAEIDPETSRLSFKERLGRIIVVLLLLAFTWTLFQIFGMMKGN